MNSRDRLAPVRRGAAPSRVSDIPGRVFLDTCVINFTLDHGEAIHDGGSPIAGTPQRVRQDIEALRGLFMTGQRAAWQLAVSHFSYAEVVATRDPARRRVLESWFFEVWHRWQETVLAGHDLPSFGDAERMRLTLLSSGLLDVLSDMPDRLLLCDALAYRCECFCTRDWSSLLRVRDGLTELPIAILTPSEWWQRVRPWAALWC